jgi:hypothetical protein
MTVFKVGSAVWILTLISGLAVGKGLTIEITRSTSVHEIMSFQAKRGRVTRLAQSVMVYGISH